MSKSKGIFLTPDLIKSKAWLSLTGASQSVYCLLRLRCKMEKIKAGGKPGRRASEWTITNNGEIVFPYTEAKKKYGISFHRFSRAIHNLIAKGFVDIEDSGFGYRRMTTFYRISNRWRLYGRPEFEMPEYKKPKQSRPGFQKDNDLWRRRKKKSTAVCGSDLTAVYGSVRALRTLKNGEIERIEYKLIDKQWLQVKTA